MLDPVFQEKDLYTSDKHFRLFNDISGGKKLITDSHIEANKLENLPQYLVFSISTNTRLEAHILLKFDIATIVPLATSRASFSGCYNLSQKPKHVAVQSSKLCMLQISTCQTNLTCTNTEIVLKAFPDKTRHNIKIDNKDNDSLYFLPHCPTVCWDDVFLQVESNGDRTEYILSLKFALLDFRGGSPWIRDDENPQPMLQDLLISWSMADKRCSNMEALLPQLTKRTKVEELVSFIKKHQENNVLTRHIPVFQAVFIGLHSHNVSSVLCFIVTLLLF